MTETPDAKSLVERVTSRSGYTRSIGIRVLNAEPGHVEFALDRREELLQFNSWFNGGVIAGLADHAAGGAATTVLPAGRIALTIDLQVNYLAPANGEMIIAIAKAIQVGQTICVSTVEVLSDGNGKRSRCAIATVTLRVVEAPWNHTER